MAQQNLSPDVRTLGADPFAEFHEPVITRLPGGYREIDRDLLHDALVQALVELCAPLGSSTLAAPAAAKGGAA
jgi:hypothetical protein